jgi:Sulfotransferase family
MTSSTQPNPPEHPKPCPDFMIVGTGRCGSTLLQAMLIAHRDIAIPYETKFFFDIDPVALGFGECVQEDDIDEYLRALRDKSSRLGVMDAYPDLYDELSYQVRNGLCEATGILHWLMHRAVQDQGGEILGEKTPGHWMKLERALELHPELKVVHIVRDPRDVTEALLRMEWWDQRSMYRTALHCAKTLRACLRWDRILGSDQHIWIRFEDLLDDRKAILTKLYAFLGVEFDESMLAHGDSTTSALNPNKERWMQRTSGEIDQSRKAKYKQKLTARQIAMIESVVGEDLMESFGYEPESRKLAKLEGSLYLLIAKLRHFISKTQRSIQKRLRSTNRS